MRKKGICIYRFKYKVKWDKIFDSLLSIGALNIGFKSLCIFIYLETGLLSFLMPLVDYTEGSKYYYLFYNIYISEHGYIWILILEVIDIIIISLILLRLVKQNLGEGLLIIEHVSLQRMKFSYNKEEISSYVVKKIRLNQYNTLNQLEISLNDKITRVISEIDIFVPKILDDVEKRNYQVGYAGIANIPATFLLGYMLGDENKKKYFHKFRNNSSDDDFHLLKGEDRQLLLLPNETVNDSTRPGKILLVIQVTQPIKEEDIKDLKEENDYIVKYEVPMTIGYDIVDSAQQINSYTNQILARIAELQKQDTISEIKICVAASSSFIFALGSKFSTTQNIDTIIFHYQNSTYPWGINVTRKVPVIIINE